MTISNSLLLFHHGLNTYVGSWIRQFVVYTLILLVAVRTAVDLNLNRGIPRATTLVIVLLLILFLIVIVPTVLVVIERGLDRGFTNDGRQVEFAQRSYVSQRDIDLPDTDKRANEVAGVVAALTGQKVNVETVNSATSAVASGPSRSGLSELLMAELKQTFIDWLKSRSDPDEPTLAYGTYVYSANQMAREVSVGSEVGLALVQMLISEFRLSIGIDSNG